MIKLRIRIPSTAWEKINELGNPDEVVSALMEVLIEYGLLDDMPPSSKQEYAKIESHIISLCSDSYEAYMLDHSIKDSRYSVSRAIMYAMELGLLDTADDIVVKINNMPTTMPSLSRHIVRQHIEKSIRDLNTICGKVSKTDEKMIRDMCKTLIQLKERYYDE